MEQVKKLFSRKKLNNEGVTLVELLVSITMLSIVVGAFYSCFVLTAKTNAKAKLAHKATSLAQNIMENIKAEDMDSLMQQIAYPTYTVMGEDGVTPKKVQNFRLVSQTGYDVNANVMNFAGVEPYAISNDGGITATYNPNVDTYQFCLRNIKLENTSFDALVTVKAPEETSIGSKDMVHIPSMDSNYDAVISNAAVYDREAVSYFESKGVYDALSPSDITRTITVEIVRTWVGDVSQVNATYRYDCEDELYETTDMVFSKESNSGNKLRNIFVFFNPHFEWSHGSEKIVIENEGNYEADVYLIKQQPSTDESVLMQETTTYRDYSVEVRMRENGINSSSYLCLKTNLGYSFLNPDEPMEGGMNKQATYYYNDGVVLSSDIEDFFHMSSLTNLDKEELLFDVTIQIYQANPDRDMTVANPFEWDTLLTEMKGTLRN